MTFQEVVDLIACLAGLVAILDYFGIKPKRKEDRPKMSLPRTAKLLIMLTLVAASLGLSGYSFYRSRRPKIVEKIIEKPVDRVVEKIVQAECPQTIPKKTPKEQAKSMQPQQSPPMTQDCGGGNCAQTSGQTGGITAGQVNIGVHREIPENIKPQLIADLAAHPGTVTINCVGCDGETMQFAKDWYKLLGKAGWAITSAPNSFTTPDALVGVSITVRGEPLAAGEKLELPNGSPAATLGRALLAVIPPQHVVGFRKPDLSENEVVIDIGIMPRD